MHLRTSAQGRLPGSQVCSQWVSSTSWRVHFLFSEPARFQASGGKAGPRQISGLQPNRLGVKTKRQPWAGVRAWGRKTRLGLALPETRPGQQGGGPRPECGVQGEPRSILALLDIPSPPRHGPPFSPPPPTLLAHFCGCLIQSQSFNVICILDSHMSTFGPGLCTESQTFLFSGLLHASLGRASDLFSNLPHPSRAPDLVFAPGPPDALSESVAQAQSHLHSSFFQTPQSRPSKTFCSPRTPPTPHLSPLAALTALPPLSPTAGLAGLQRGSPWLPPRLPSRTEPRPSSEQPSGPAVQFSAGRCLIL